MIETGVGRRREIDKKLIAAAITAGSPGGSAIGFVALMITASLRRG